jgi:hypothetical protein
MMESPQEGSAKQRRWQLRGNIRFAEARGAPYWRKSDLRFEVVAKLGGCYQ